MKVLGIDYGRKRLGIAICGELKIASPLMVIKRESIDIDIQKLKKIIEENDVNQIVIGLPKNMNNSQGKMAKEAKEFGEILASEIDLPIVYWDERLTTRQADCIMKSVGISASKRRRSRDQIAAALMLQSYVDYHSQSL